MLAFFLLEKIVESIGNKGNIPIFAAPIIKGKEMNKHLISIVLTLAMGLFFTSCGNKSLEGTWIEPAKEDGIVGEIGFTLLKDGSVVPINMGYSEFNAWEKVGDKIIFKGHYSGTNPHEFMDTLRIVKLTDTELVLEQAGYTVTYERK